MSEHCRAATRPSAPSITRRRRLLVGALGALGAGGLLLGGVGAPVSAGELTAAGNPHASVDVRDGCVTAAAGTGGADGSVAPQEGSDEATIEATGQGTATATVCREDLEGPPPVDPGGSLPDDPGDIVSPPGELEDVPGDPGGSLEGEVVGTVTAVLEGELPGGGDGSFPGDLPDGPDGIVPGDGVPGVPGDGSVPGDPGDLPGLIPGGPGIGVGDVVDRLGAIITRPGDGGGPGDGTGNGGGSGPAVNTSTNGSATVTVGGVDAERDDSTGGVPGSELAGGAPALVGSSVSPGTLPRTGGGLGVGVLRLVAVLGFGRGLVGLAKRG